MDFHAGESRRSRFLVLAAWLADAYVVAYAADATLSMIDELVRLAAGSSPLGTVRSLVASAVVLATLPALLLTILVPPLPRAVLIPPILSVFWFAIGAPPVGVQTTHMLALSAVQLLIAANALRIVHRRSGRWLLSATRLPVLRHLWLRAVGGLAVSAVLGVVLLIGFSAAAIVQYLESMTGGYMQLTWTGIELRETTFQRGDTTVHLVATAHIAEPQYYRKLRASIPDGALVLIEGVTDHGGRLQGFSQRPAAQALGLSTQDVFNALLPEPEEVDDEEESGADADSGPTGRAQPRVVRADVDTEIFSEKAIDYLLDIDRIMRSPTMSEGVRRWMEVSRRFPAGEQNEVLDEIVNDRNAVLLSTFDLEADGYATVFVPWGAMHMPGLEKGLRERQFRVVATNTMTMARYREMLRRQPPE